MGHSTEPDPPGENCGTCFFEGKAPSSVYVSYTGITDCNPDNVPPPIPWNDSVRLPQIFDEPCFYLYEGPLWAHEWLAALGDMATLKQKWGAGFFFSGLRDQDCAVWFESLFENCGAGHLGAEGNGLVMWNVGTDDHSIGSLLNAINMEPEAETKFEFWPAAEGRGMVRFARKKDATNILILVEPTEL